MPERDRQRPEAEQFDRLHEVAQETFRRLELADPGLGCDLPRRRRADVDIGVGIADEPPQSRRDALVTSHPPDQRVRVEQRSHQSPRPSHAFSSSSDSGSKKTESGSFSFPLSAPKARRRRTYAGASTGTSRATGFRPRAMTTSSPFSTRSMSFERLVLAP